MAASIENQIEPLIGISNSIQRRAFLSAAVKAVGTLAVANGAVYLIGSAFKELDGSLVAGAKCAPGVCPGAMWLCNNGATVGAASFAVAETKCAPNDGGPVCHCSSGVWEDP